MLVGADGANSAIAKKLAGPLQASDMEVAFGYRAPLPEQAEVPTVIAFLPGWVGYAWAFPRVDHISFGIATTQDAFEHKALDELLWQFMIWLLPDSAKRQGKHLEDLTKNPLSPYPG
jgi:flavin-dependent dehydrogenase